MWLAIDVGNTNIHMGFFEGDKLRSLQTVRGACIQTFQVHLPDIFKKGGVVVVSSVNPEIERLLHEWFQKYAFSKILYIGKDIPVPLHVLTDYPEKVGIDRLLNAIAVFQHTRRATIIIDAGTAITIDVVDENGAFLGGVIAPGIDLSSKALHSFTALLPEISVNRPRSVLGRCTEEAIKSGVYWGTIGMVEHIILKLFTELGYQPIVIATGGNAALLAEEIHFIKEVIPHLTLEGIKITYLSYI